MITTLKTFFSTRILVEKQAPTEHELQLASAALLLEVSVADSKIEDIELEEISRNLKVQFSLSTDEIEELVSLAKHVHGREASLFPFLCLINEYFSMQQKCGIVEAMWRVAYADQHLDKYEEHQIRRIADLLHVSHKDYIRTKLRVQEGG